MSLSIFSEDINYLMQNNKKIIIENEGILMHRSLLNKQYFNKLREKCKFVIIMYNF